MRTPCAHKTAPALAALLKDGALAGNWVLDSRNSTIGLMTRAMWGTTRVDGVFREVSGSGTVSPTGDVSGTLTVAAASIDTKVSKRDAHLRSDDFFASDSYPDIIFTADGIRASGQGVAVTGELTVRGRTRALVFESGVSVLADGEIWLDAEVQINRADFGLTWNLMGSMSKQNTLTIHLVFSKA